MELRDVYCEYRRNPIGIDTQQPRFTWKYSGTGEQHAYQVLVNNMNGETFFDSGIVIGNAMNCLYTGKELQPQTEYKVSIHTWDLDDVEYCQNGSFETGIGVNAFQAKWITGKVTDKEERLPADYYRKEFVCKKEKLLRARLYATACGVYTARVNGVRLPGVLAPGTTEYEKHLYYQTYDITEYLKSENVLDFTVGDGWFKGKIGSSNNQNFFGNQTKLLAQLVMDYVDGTQEVIGTDESFTWTNDGPICYSDLKDGEIVDAGKTLSFTKNAVVTNYETTLIGSSQNLIIEHEKLVPQLLISPSGQKILDFGQNIAGYIHFVLPDMEAGTVVKLKMCEVLDHEEYTNITVQHSEEGIPEIRQEIVYTCKKGENEFEPEFFYSGFRYALLEGLDEVDPTCFQAIAIYTDFDFVGEFHCSNELLNQFVENTKWSLKSNFVDVPTDCPQREKSAWTGDAQIFAKTATYFTNTAAFYRKWLVDVRDCQREDGRIENVSPKIRRNDKRDSLNGSVGWADAAVIIPYTMWKMYGDTRFITENYPLMHDWKEYVKRSAADKSIYSLPDGHPLKGLMKQYLLPESEYNGYIIESGMHWGEWAEPDAKFNENPMIALVKPKQEVTSAYTHYSMGLLEEMLRAINCSEEADECHEWVEGTARAYHYHFVKNGCIESEQEAPYVRALQFELLSVDEQKKAADTLNSIAVERNYKVGTGFLSTPFVLQVLVQQGFVDTAYKMLVNEEAPGWLAMPKHGATTVWEEYNCFDENGVPLKHSMNHYSPGAVCGFLFDTVCGINISGENQFRIKPVPGMELSEASASYDSIYGLVKCQWKRVNNQVKYMIEIPANTSAEVLLPDGTHHCIASGIHKF